MAAEPCGAFYHEAAKPRGLVLLSDTFHDAKSGGAPIAFLSRSDRPSEAAYYSTRLTTKPLARDHIGHPVSRPLDNLGAVHFTVMSADGLAPSSAP
jgi:hypothetical protein